MEKRVKALVKETIEKLFGVEREYIFDHSDLIDDLGLDSLDLIELEMELEKVLQVELDDDSIMEMKIKTVSDIYDVYDKLFS